MGNRAVKPEAEGDHMYPEAEGRDTYVESAVDPTVAGPKPKGCTESFTTRSPLGESLKPKGQSLDRDVIPEAEGRDTDIERYRRSAV